MLSLTNLMLCPLVSLTLTKVLVLLILTKAMEATLIVRPGRKLLGEERARSQRDQYLPLSSKVQRVQT